VCAQLYLNIFPEMGIKLDKEHRYEQVPKLVETVMKVSKHYGINK